MAETRLFRVRFSFTGTDAVQLTVKKDEIVTANGLRLLLATTEPFSLFA